MFSISFITHVGRASIVSILHNKVSSNGSSSSKTGMNQLCCLPLLSRPLMRHASVHGVNRQVNLKVNYGLTSVGLGVFAVSPSSVRNKQLLQSLKVQCTNS